MNLRSLLDIESAVALPVALFDPIALLDVAPRLLALPAALLAPPAPIALLAPPVPVVPVEAAGRLDEPELVVPGAVFCAETAAAMQNETTPAIRAGPEKRMVDIDPSIK
jgi:hypothetical protein